MMEVVVLFLNIGSVYFMNQLMSILLFKKLLTPFQNMQYRHIPYSPKKELLKGIEISRRLGKRRYQLTLPLLSQMLTLRAICPAEE